MLSRHLDGVWEQQARVSALGHPGDLAHRTMLRSVALQSGAWLCHFLAVWPWASYSTSLSLSFLSGKIGVSPVPN